MVGAGREKVESNVKMRASGPAPSFPEESPGHSIRGCTTPMKDMCNDMIDMRYIQVIHDEHTNPDLCGRPSCSQRQGAPATVRSAVPTLRHAHGPLP